MQSIYQYNDYRHFLRDYYLENKRRSPSFSFRQFAMKAGLASPMHYRLVMSGERNLSSKTIQTFAKGLKLNSRETKFFENLVYYTQSKSSEEKIQFHQKLTSLKISLAGKLTQEKQEGFFSKWYYPVVYELCGTNVFNNDPKWIVQKLEKRIKLTEAKEAVEHLCKLGLIKNTVEGKIVHTGETIITDDEIENLRVRSYHKKMMDIAKEKIDMPLGEREFGFVTIASNSEKFLKLKQMIKEFLDSANQELSSSTDKTDVCQLNIQFFKI